MASFIPELSHIKNKDGSSTLYIRITTKGSGGNSLRKRVNTGLRIEPRHWNETKREVRTSHKDYHSLNEAIRQEISRLRKIHTDGVACGVKLSASEIQHRSNFDDTGTSFFAFTEHMLAEYKSAGKYETYKSRESQWRMFRTWLKNDSVTFSGITVDVLNRYIMHLQSIGNSDNTIFMKMKRLKEVFNRAIREEVISSNPFSRLRKLELKEVKKTKLDTEEVERIEALNLEPGTLIWHVRNMWLFSFYCAGIRVFDLLTMTERNLIGSRLIYRMGKTGVEKSIVLHTRANEILSHYLLKKNAKVNPYRTIRTNVLFPLIDNNTAVIVEKVDQLVTSQKTNYRVPFETMKLVKAETGKKTALLNKYLRKIQAMVGTDKQIRNHIARHSFAQLAKSKRLSQDVIQDLLGHKTASSTRHYLSKGFDDSVQDEALKNVFGD